MGCAAKQDFDGVQVNCGKCNYCLGRRIGSWVNRAMMEKASFPHAFAMTLTYNGESNTSRLGAQTFIYRHVIDLNKRLRRAIEYHLGVKASAFSFMVAGEFGSRFKRCHWHMIVFSEVDLCKVGTWIDHQGRTVSAFDDIVSPTGKGYNRTWSLWPHGFVAVQVPDFGGMRYALAYALKDQFNSRNAEGTAREHKADPFAVGMFRMSKKPPIGQRFVDRYLDECRAAGIVPPSRRLVIPEVKFPFFPTGVLADRLLAGFADINASVRAATGKDAAGWSSLVYESRLSERDLELLGVYDGDADEQEAEAEMDGQIVAGRAADDNASNAKLQAARDNAAARRRCFSTEACSLCVRGRGQVPGIDWDEFNRPYRIGATAEAFRKAQSDGCRESRNPWCGFAFLPEPGLQKTA